MDELEYTVYMFKRPLWSTLRVSVRRLAGSISHIVRAPRFQLTAPVA